MRLAKTNKKNFQQEYFTKQQIICLSSKSWWIANTQGPFLVKFATFQSAILMKCTNLSTLYVKRFNQDQINKDKDDYVKALTVKDFKHLLELFEGLLSQRDERGSKYRFEQNLQGGWLDFKFQKQIQFFPFMWKFRLFKVQSDVKDIICNEIINPLSFALERQTRRQQILRKKTEQMEKDYVKKLTDTEKKMYKSPFVETQQEWKQLCKKQQIHYNLNSFNKQRLFTFVYSDFVSFAIKQFLRPFMEQKPKVQIQTLLQARNNAPQKSSNSKSRTVNVMQEEEQSMELKLKYTKQDEKKAKNIKKKQKSFVGIDFL